MDTGPFLQHLTSQSHSEFVRVLDKKLQELNFKVVLKDLGPSLFSAEVDHAAAIAFLMQCLAYCQRHSGDLTAGIRHLLLELIPAAGAQAAGHDIRSAAVQMFHEYCTPQDAKLAAKVATIFKLRREDLTDWPSTAHAVQSMLANQSSYKAAVHLLMQFEGFDEHIDKVEVITQLVTDGQENLAQQWVATLGKDYQITFIEACVTLDRLKPAARAVRVLGLAAEFPNIEALYRQRSLARLVGKRLWQVALSFVGSDTALQTLLVREMVDAGELSLAEDYRQQLGLPESVVAVDPAAVAAQEVARRERYLQLELPEGQLLFVDGVEGLAQATKLLHGSDVLGLDVEWQPSHVAGAAAPAAILQLATRSTAVLFDLITLATHHAAALDACLSPLFASPDVLKLGFELTGDLAKLAGSWTDIAAFKTVAGVLDLRPLWVAYGLQTRRQGASVRLLSAVGLSTLCNTLLGKPLDKSQQMSDWNARPLSLRQVQYAALDAYVLPKLFDRLCEELGPDRSKQLLRLHTATVNRVSAEQYQQQHQAGRAVPPWRQRRVNESAAAQAMAVMPQPGSQQQQTRLNQHKRQRGAQDVQSATPPQHAAGVRNGLDLGHMMPPVLPHRGTGMGSSSSCSTRSSKIEVAAARAGVLPIHKSFLEEDSESTAALLEPVSDLPLNENGFAGGGGGSSSDNDTGNSGGSSSSSQQQQLASTMSAADSTAGNTTPAETGEARVVAFLKHRGFERAFRRLNTEPKPGTVVTACQTAAALAVPRAAVAKTMALLVDQDLVLVATRGDQRVDMHKLAGLLGVRRRALRLAPNCIVQEITGFASGIMLHVHDLLVGAVVCGGAGGVPPIGNDSRVKVLLDHRLQGSAAQGATESLIAGAATPGVGGPIPYSQPTPQAANHEQQQQGQPTLCRSLGPSQAAWAGQQADCLPQAPSSDVTPASSTDSCFASCSCAAAAAAAETPAATCSTCCGSVQLRNASAGAAAPAGAGSSTQLYLQCGARAVMQLTYEQLVELSGGTVVDVAEVPADKPAADAGSSSAAAAVGDDDNDGGDTKHQLNGAVQFNGRQQSAPRFLLDSMLGRLCRWLRALGVDAAFVEAGSTRQPQEAQAQAQAGQQLVLERQQQGRLVGLIHRAALTEGRLFLTRDTKLAARRDVGGSVYLLNTDDAAEQLTEISRHFGIRFDESAAMSRCSNCNAAAFQQITPEAAAAALVPAKVMKVVEEFWQCGSCGKVFWMGPKSYAAINLLEGLFTDGKTRPTPLQSLRPGYASAGAEANRA